MKTCKLFHDWEVIRDTIKHQYVQCKRCGERGVFSRIEGYQPIDMELLNG